jgi:hypothetical protein
LLGTFRVRVAMPQSSFSSSRSSYSILVHLLFILLVERTIIAGAE